MIINKDGEILVVSLKVRIKKWFAARKLHSIALISSVGMLILAANYLSTKLVEWHYQEFVQPLLK